MKNQITITLDNHFREQPSLVVTDNQKNQIVMFKKIEFKDQCKKQLETSVILKSLHKINHEIHSFRLIKVFDIPFRQRRKSECDGLISKKILNIDLKYPKTIIEQHQFLERVKALRRKAIKGRMKTKFQKSFRKMSTTKNSLFNSQHHHTIQTRNSIYGSLQDIKVIRTFARDRPFYQQIQEKKESDSICDSPSTPCFHRKNNTQKIGVTQKQKQFVLLQLNKFSPKTFTLLKNDSIQKILSETKETQSQTHARTQTSSVILNKFQPYFCNSKVMNLKKSCNTYSSRIKTAF